jgi:hypothetical protein
MVDGNLAPQLEPSESFRRIKRWLLVFAGALFIDGTIGLEISGRVNENLALPIEELGYFDEALAVTVLFFCYQLSLYWEVQNLEIRENRFFRIDKYSTSIIAIASLATYVAQLTYDSSTQNLLRDIFDLIGSFFVWSVVFACLIILNLVLERLLAFRIQNYRDEQQKVGSEAATLLLENEWKFVIDPQTGRHKKFTFKDNGEIGEGQNRNENTWRIRKNFLELINSQGQIYSRFKYDPERKGFFHTNDQDTVSLRDQQILLWREGI